MFSQNFFNALILLNFFKITSKILKFFKIKKKNPTAALKLTHNSSLKNRKILSNFSKVSLILFRRILKISLKFSKVFTRSQPKCCPKFLLNFSEVFQISLRLLWYHLQYLYWIYTFFETSGSKISVKFIILSKIFLKLYLTFNFCKV